MASGKENPKFIFTENLKIRLMRNGSLKNKYDVSVKYVHLYALMTWLGSSVNLHGNQSAAAIIITSLCVMVHCEMTGETVPLYCHRV